MRIVVPTARELHTRKLVIFDFDGTLANTKPYIVRTATKVLLEFGLKPEELGDVGRLVGPPFPEAYSLVYGLSKEDAQRVTDRYREIYASLGPQAWPLFPGVRELLQELHEKGHLTAVASSKRQNVLERSLADDNVLGSFDLVAGKPSDGAVTKAETIAAVLKQLEVPPSDAVMVGDRKYDIEGARACGVAGVGVTYTDGSYVQELVDSGAVALCDSVAELGQLLL